MGEIVFATMLSLIFIIAGIKNYKDTKKESRSVIITSIAISAFLFQIWVMTLALVQAV